MGLWDDAVSAATAIGNGIYSVGEDLYYGTERTAEGLLIDGVDRAAEIGTENELLANLLQDLFKYGVTAPESPLFKIVSEIMAKYYENVPEDLLKKIAKAAAISVGGYTVGRMVIGKTVATAIAKKVAVKVAQTTAYKQFAKKLGVSAAAGSTGIGIPITLTMFQGVAQRSSHASKRLREGHPMLYRDLRRQKGLDMLYFLVEKPLKPYLDGIALAHRDRNKFIDGLRKSLEGAK